MLNGTLTMMENQNFSGSLAKESVRSMMNAAQKNLMANKA